MIRLTSLALFAVLIAPGLAVGCQPSPPQSILRQSLPTELSKELDERLRVLRLKHPLSLDAEKRVRDAVAATNLQYESLSQAHYRTVAEVGRGAIPVIADLLMSQDRATRLRAQRALGRFTKLREEITEAYADDEALLILLYRRSLLDVDPEMRSGAVAALFGIGSQRLRALPASVVAALRDAMANDPDASVRKLADYSLQDLGVIPRDPSRTAIVN